jgi:inosine/guanosine/xanthosine phosphorylase family protein
MTWQLAPEWEQRISDAAASVCERGFGRDARLGLVLGSGLGGVVDAMEISAEASFDEVRGFASASVKAHAGRVLQARASGQEILVLQGRPHAYEGLSSADVVLPVAVLERLGCSVVVLTNAAGGLRPQMVAGELAVLDDLVDLHLHDVARGILVGDPGIDAGLFARAARPGAVFDPGLADCIERAARSERIGLRRATYASVWGPNYEESATIGWLRRIGADVVGMSTGPEAAYLKAVGVRVAGLSCITNVAVEHGAAEVSHDEVVQVGGESGTEFSTLLLAALPELIALAKGEK